MTSFINLLNYFWPLLLAGGVLSPIAASVNKFIKAQKAIVKWAVVFAMSSLVAVGHAFIMVKTKDAHIIAVQAALITFFSTPVYLTIIKPLFEWIGGQFAKAAAFDAQVKSAAEPVEPPTV